MKLSMGQKAERVLKLLLGLENERVMGALLAYGFTEADKNEGWALLRGLGQGKLSQMPNTVVNSNVVQQLDKWENRWFPVASASLARRYPQVHERLFLNLSQTEGPEVVISVRTLIDRLDQLSAGHADYGPDAAAARKLLETRGLTEAVVNEARAVLESLGRIDIKPAPPVAREQQQEQLSKAESEMWAWYLEWSQLARVAIKQRSLLRQLGFLSSSRSPDAADGTDDLEDTPMPAPAPTPTTTSGITS
jgi:hypothetical protein